MKKNIKIFGTIILFFSIILTSYNVFASTSGEIEISQRYLDYLNLSEEERENTIPPETYDIPKNSQKVTNPLRRIRMLKSTLESRYSLKDIIPENMIVKNQAPQQICWAFAILASLESNLALRDYKAGKQAVVYDFSERHLDYATTRVFLDDKINPFGFNRKAGSAAVNGLPISYLTNGLGAVLEEDMKFEQNTDLIDISEIQNKKIATQVKDIVTLPTYSSQDDTTEIRRQIKEHVMNYGAIKANICGRMNVNGAIYCSSTLQGQVNHSVAIIGWDDEYSVENFPEINRPQNPGAFIAKNSYGEQSGDEGFCYISYEDIYVYSELTGITNAQTELDYENIYQYDELGGYLKYTEKEVSKIFLATEFDKKTNDKEYLTQVSIRSPETYICKVYVNPNGTSKKIEDLQPVMLKTGETQKISAGYHTLEFAEPIKIGDNFVVVMEIEGTRENTVSVLVEVNFGEFFTDPKYANAPNHAYDTVTISDSKCFLATEEDVQNDTWADATKLYETTNGKLPNFDTTIKAFTTSKVEIVEKEVESIRVVTPPTKTEYFVGEDFNPEGLVIEATYEDGTTENIENYEIENGIDLEEGQSLITITYKGQKTTQQITVKQKQVIEPEKVIDEITINKLPAKIQYIEKREQLDLTGGTVKIVYNDGTNEEIDMTSTEIKVNGFDNTKVGKQTITLTYKEKKVQFDIEIKELEKPINSNLDDVKVDLKNIKAYYFTNDSKKDYVILNMKIYGFTKQTGNESMEYYYYISKNPNEKNITNWIKLEDFSLEVNTLNLANYDELADADEIYLYVKEVAIKNDMESEKVTKALLLNSKNINIEKYVDGKKDADDTLAPGEIPYAGKNALILSIALIISIIGRTVYIKYKNIEIK